jgi:hypothetical protein
VRALATDRQAAAVTEAAVAAEVHQALDVHLDLATEIALDAVLGLEQLADALDLVLGEILGLLVLGDPCLLADLLREGAADSVEVRKRVRDVLVAGEVDACNASHDVFPFSRLTLALLMARVVTDDANDALAPDHLALVADLLD